MIKIGNKEYDLVLTTEATKEIAKRYGNLSKLGEKLEGRNFEDSLDDIIWLITLLANQWIKRNNYFEGTKTPLLTEEAVGVLTSPSDIIDFTQAIQEAMLNGTERVVLSEEPKN